MEKIKGARLSWRGLNRWDSPVSRVFANLPELETPRLRLRKIRMRDAEDLYAWSRDPEVAKYVLWTAHRSIRETRDYIRYVRSLYRQGAPSSWGVELKETGRVIGTMGIMGWNPEYRCMEVGYSFGQAWWRRGYAPEALERVLGLIFEETDINRVEGQCDVRNPASARVMEKCGMQREGILRQRVLNKGEMIDVMLYAILKEDWDRRQKTEKTVLP